MPSPLIIPGTIYRLAETGLAVASIVEPAIDQKAMSATATICTTAVDRQSEVIMPDGVDFADYQKNPVVLWGHGFNSAIPLPIAKSESPDGKLTIQRSKDRIDATSYFTTKSVESQQIFDLIVERIIRATSIHVLPVESVNQVVQGDQVTIYSKSKMLEWSWCDIPCNPEAIRKVLDRGKLAGEPILESIAKTLRPFAPVASRSTVRVGFDKENDVATKPKTMTPEEEAAAAKAKSEADAAAKAAADAAANNNADQPADEPADDSASDAGDDSPPSVRVANGVHAALSQLMSNLESAANQYEDPRAKEYFGGAFMEQCKALATEVEGLISELGGKAAKSEGGEKDEAAAEEAMKTFLAGGVRQRLQVLGMAAPLEALAAAKNLTPDQKLTVQTVLKSIRKTVSQAKADADGSKTKALEKQVADAAATFTTLSKSMADLQSQFKDILPANA